MKISIRVLGFLILFTCCVAEVVQHEETEPPLKEGWERLFDGSTLENWEITSFGGEGRVYPSDGDLILGFGETLTGVTWKSDFPTDNYEVRLEAKRVQGSDFFCGMTFPVRESFCSLIVGGWGGALVGISSIDGLDASENATSRAKRFERHQWYRIRLRVGEGKVKAWIDDELMVDLEIEGVELEVRPEVRLSRPFGIAAWQTTAALRNIHLRRN
jgi:hypothetical protein